MKQKTKQDQSLERETEKKIRESERRLTTLMSNLPGMSYRCRNDRNWTMEFVSEGCQQLTGYNPEDLIENKRIPYNEIIHPEDRDYIWNTWQQVLQTNKTFKDEYRIITKDGSLKWVWEQGRGVFSENGDLLALEGFITDITDRKRAEAELHDSRRIIESILNTIPVRVFWKDLNGFYLGCNKPFALDAGVSSPDNIIGKDDYQMGWLDQAELYRADDRAVIESGQARIGYEEPQTTPDGKQRWLRTSKIPLRNSENEIVGVLGTYEDITEQKQSEELLRRSESLFRTVLEESRDGMRLTNEEGIVLKVNKAFCRLVEMKREDIEGKPLSVIYEKERGEYILQRHQERFTTKTVAPHYQKELTLRNGKKVWFEVSNSYFEHNDQKPLLLSVFRDITTRVHSERALRESEVKYRTLFEESKDAIYISTPEGKLHDINPAGVEMFGYSSREEMQALDIVHDLYYNPEDRDVFIRLLNQNGYVKNFELVLKRKDGSSIIVLETATSVHDKSGTPLAYRGILRDITQQRMLEEQLRHVQKMESIGTLAGGIAHDFNNILSIIVGHASLLKMHKSNPDRLTRGVETILKATQRGASLVQQLLTFARKSDITYEPVRINDIITEIAQLLHETLPKKIEVKINLEQNIPSMVADVTQIHQVLLNLALNARDAMPKGGVLSITSTIIPGNTVRSKILKSFAPEYILVRVTDTGTGMDEWTKQRVFDPFFTTKRPGKGTGLGLALVYSIIESYNGFVDVESEPGIGTTFSIYLPVPQTEVTLTDISTRTEIEDPGGSETILIIEDEEMLLDSLKSTLLERGYSVVTARDGEEGVQMYSLRARDLFGNGIDVVISDLGLPKLSGDEVFKKIRSINPEAKIILASGFIDPTVKMELKKAGLKYFVQKPYSPDKVIQTIRQILDDDNGD